MYDNELKKYLIKEEEHTFMGWDFSYLNNRWENEILPWDYKKILLKYLNPTDTLLDMGTGGGEFLLTLNHPHQLTSVTEAYEPNIKLCQEILAPKGIKVYPITENNQLTNIPSNHFDMVVNRHESYDENEVYRVLKKGGIFITQQIGAFNNKDIATFFDDNHTDQFPEMTLEKSVQRLINKGFKVIDQQEYYPKIKFFDLGAIAYFAKIISWEFIDFSVERHFDKFIDLDKRIKEVGYIESTEHRFLIISKK